SISCANSVLPVFMTNPSPRHRRGEPPAIQIRPSNEVLKTPVRHGLTGKLGSRNRTLVDIESKAAQSREHAGIEPDTRAVFAEGEVAAVVRSCLDPPMRTDCLGRAGGVERFVGDVECGLHGAAQQSGPGAAAVDNTLDRMMAET